MYKSVGSKKCKEYREWLGNVEKNIKVRNLLNFRESIIAHF